MRRLLIALIMLLPVALQAQSPALTAAAERARLAWFEHDAAGLVAQSPSVLVQLPGADPSAPLERAQAAALLRDYLARGQEVETLVRSARELGAGRGYVELERRYRIADTKEVRTQTLLLGYQHGPDGWTLVEVRVVE